MNGNAAPRGGENKSDAALDISVRVYPVTNQPEKGNLLAFANVTLGGCFAVNDLRVMNSVKGPFVAMPSKMGADGKYHDTCFPTTARMRENLNAAVMREFERVTRRQSVRGTFKTDNGKRRRVLRLRRRAPDRRRRGKCPYHA